MIKELTNQFPSVQGFVISNPADIFYLTGFYCVDCLVLYSEDPVLVTDSRYTVASKEASCRAEIVSGDYVQGIIDQAKKQGLTTLGIQEDYLTAADYVKLTEAGFTLIETKGAFTSLRAAKTDEEIEKISAAQKITDKAFENILDFIRPGVTEKEVRARLEYLMFSYGADGIAFETIVASGANGAKPHAVPSDKVIKEGEFVTLDFGARLNNYDSDMTRTVAVGEVSREMEKIYFAVLEAHKRGAQALKAGVECSYADSCARKYLESVGLGDFFSHSLGHGVGIEIHESPRLSKVSKDILTVGNVVTVEPGVYLEGFCGVRIENMFVITRDGAVDLTASDKNLIKL
ncbi:MAG: aminopeptidase P family protein [Clostridia bacterium]|nr:aminopeptidase P family protein [Clostridia bacterium]